MKNLMMTLAVMFLLAACGLQPVEEESMSAPPQNDAGTAVVPDAGNDDAGDVTPTDAGTVTTPDAGTPALPGNLDPVRLTNGVLEFSQLYVSDAPCGDVKGSGPMSGLGWDEATVGLVITAQQLNGYLQLAPSSMPTAYGDYTVSYRGSSVCPVNAATSLEWAQYGAQATLTAMSAAGRSWVTCNWYLAETDACITQSASCSAADEAAHLCVRSASCGIAFHRDAAGITPAGNVTHFAGCH